MGRIGLTDGTLDVIEKLSEGDVGATSFLLDMLKREEWYGNAHTLTYILHLDDLRLYGAQLNNLYNGCCNRNLDQVELVLRNHQMGILSSKTINNHTSKGRGIPFDNLIPLKELFDDEAM